MFSKMNPSFTINFITAAEDEKSSRSDLVWSTRKAPELPGHCRILSHYARCMIPYIFLHDQARVLTEDAHLTSRIYARLTPYKGVVKNPSDISL